MVCAVDESAAQVLVIPRLNRDNVWEFTWSSRNAISHPWFITYKDIIIGSRNLNKGKNSPDGNDRVKRNAKKSVRSTRYTSFMAILLRYTKADMKCLKRLEHTIASFSLILHENPSHPKVSSGNYGIKSNEYIINSR